MKGVEQGNGYIDGDVPDIVKICPTFLFIGFDGRVIFGEAQFESAVGIDMAVGDMMHYLLYGPSSLPVWGQQLCLVQVEERILQELGEKFDIVQPSLFLFVRERLGLVIADGIAKFFQG